MVTAFARPILGPRSLSAAARALGATLTVLAALIQTGTPSLVSSVAAASAPADCVLPDGGSMGRLDWDTFRRPIGTVRAVMLLVDFPDVPATRPLSTGSSRTSRSANASGWLARSSNGKVSLEIEPLRQWLRMPEPLSAYKRVNGALIDDVARRYTAQAIALADAAVDFSQVDVVYIVPNAEATAYARSSQHDYAPDEGPIADGRVLRASVTFGTAVYERGYRTLVHETSHTFGLYDYYNAFGRPTDKYAGAWSLMADSIRGADHFAWDKWRMGWLGDAQIRCITGPTRAEYVLSPLETGGGVKAVILRTGLRSAVVAEYRTRQGLDAGICSTGVLIYKVNSGLEAGAGPIRVSDARPRSASSRRTCGAELDDAAFGRGRRWTDSTSGLTIDVSYVGRAARIQVTRTKMYAPPVTYERSITANVTANGDGSVTVTALLAASGAFVPCTAGRPMSLQEFRAGAWWTIRTANTDSLGGWTHTWLATPGATYRLRAPQRVTSASDCVLALSSPITVT